MLNAMYTPRTSNRKTGDVPQQFVGSTREQSKASCDGCPLLANRKCYAQYGSEAWAHSAMVKAQAKKDYSLENALAHRAKDARFVRMGALGDPSAIERRALLRDMGMIRAAGLGILGYTHFWKAHRWLKGKLMASCDTWQQVRQAVKSGWRATLYVEHGWVEENGTKGRKDGVRYAVCPYQTHGTQCNKCGICDAGRQSVDVVIFKIH